MSSNYPEKSYKEIIKINELFFLIDGESYRKNDFEGQELKIIDKLVGIVDKLIQSRNRPIFTLSINIQNQIYIMANVSLVIGSPKSGAFTLIDNKTLLPINGVTYSNQAVGSNSNPEFATFALDPSNPNNVIGTPISAGSGTVVITTD